jgi:hypothetical protein
MIGDSQVVPSSPSFRFCFPYRKFAPFGLPPTSVSVAATRLNFRKGAK